MNKGLVLQLSPILSLGRELECPETSVYVEYHHVNQQHVMPDKPGLSGKI